MEVVDYSHFRAWCISAQVDVGRELVAIIEMVPDSCAQGTLKIRDKRMGSSEVKERNV